MATRSGLMVLGVAALAAFLSLTPVAAQNAGPNWVAAWGASQQGLGETKISNATVFISALVCMAKVAGAGMYFLGRAG